MNLIRRNYNDGIHAVAKDTGQEDHYGQNVQKKNMSKKGPQLQAVVPK
jgi:hypothetical protein